MSGRLESLLLLWASVGSFSVFFFLSLVCFGLKLPTCIRGGTGHYSTALSLDMVSVASRELSLVAAMLCARFISCSERHLSVHVI